MAAPVVAALVTRIEDGSDISGWASIGGGPGPGVDNAFFYEGGTLVSRRVTSSSGAGFYYSPSSDTSSSYGAQDMTGKVWLIKAMVTDYGGLQTTNGVRVRVGSSTTARYEWVIAGSDQPANSFKSYPAKGGFLLIPLDPSLSDYGRTVAATPNLSSVDYYGLVAAFSSSTAKSENVGLDAIDILEVAAGGLFVADGVGQPATFKDLSDWDEGIISNRYGLATYTGSVGLVGPIRIGRDTSGAAVATEFADSSNVVIWQPHLAGAGFSVLFIDLGSASTSVTIDNTHVVVGERISAAADQRPDVQVVGTTGSCIISGSLPGFRRMEFTSAVEVTGTIGADTVVQGGAHIHDAIIITTQPSSTTGTIVDPTFGASSGLHDTEFVQGSGGTHAIEITAAGSYNLTGIKFTGYGANGTSTSAIYVSATSGTVTLNISGGGDTPTYTSAGATVVVNNTVLVRVTVLDAETLSPIQGARVYIEADTGGPDPAGTQYLNALTDANGIAEDASFAYAGDQPIIGRVRKASSPPYYRPVDFTGTITSTGFTLTVLMQRDE